MPLPLWAPRWPLAAFSRREIAEAALTSLSARATVVPSPNPSQSPNPFPTRPQPCILSAPTTDPPLEQTLTDLSDDGFIGSHDSPQTHTGLLRSLIPLRDLHLKKKTLPPSSSHCRHLHLLLSLSLHSLCLILVCAFSCHIKGEPGVTEPQAENINAANSMAV